MWSCLENSMRQLGMVKRCFQQAAFAVNQCDQNVERCRDLRIAKPCCDRPEISYQGIDCFWAGSISQECG
jgi:hypothetical protein